MMVCQEKIVGSGVRFSFCANFKFCSFIHLRVYHSNVLGAHVLECAMHQVPWKTSLDYIFSARLREADVFVPVMSHNRVRVASYFRKENCRTFYFPKRRLRSATISSTFINRLSNVAAERKTNDPKKRLGSLLTTFKVKNNFVTFLHSAKDVSKRSQLGARRIVEITQRMLLYAHHACSCVAWRKSEADCLLWRFLFFSSCCSREYSLSSCLT